MFNLVVLSYFVTASGYHMTSIVLVALFFLQCVLLIKFIAKTNQELTRFLDAMRFADYSQRFELNQMGSGFAELGQTFGEILTKFQQLSSQKETQHRHIKAIVEHVPVPLMSINAKDEISLWNHAARQLFGTHPMTKLSDLQLLSSDFLKHIKQVQPGEKRIAQVSIDGMQHQLSLAATQINLPDTHEKLISLQDIQNELEGAQLQAWQDLVKVLTHEIMNSITPVASLANTAVSLVDNTKSKTQDLPELREDLDDIGDAVNTVARRSDGLIQFVSSYRKLTQLPTPHKKIVRLKDLFNQVALLASQDWLQKQITLDIQITPSELELTADADMLSQVLLNLLKNAEHAVIHKTDAKIEISAYLNPRGHVVIEVSDNGSGINQETEQKIFIPFFTTKPKGSGVGLALTRQIMLAHGGNVKYSINQNGGATFSLRF
ncbi:ATP-binding protein [Paraglaciecola aquimarina]|uniref:histidine kinase n=1 Tax=Paraglaciecola algarum TaxID=3050085 RepID=A0ABS9D4R7_9ALTE|nr:ATP-binding protein [Paraglaciecola sp. G1-23]MCF2947911.1 ATP-binding protein [Paraglaciecola sp. G1-23]